MERGASFTSREGNCPAGVGEARGCRCRGVGKEVGEGVVVSGAVAGVRTQTVQGVWA